jgi:hypothetical protein
LSSLVNLFVINRKRVGKVELEEDIVLVVGDIEEILSLLAVVCIFKPGVLTPPRSLAFLVNALGTGWKAIDPMTPVTPRTDSVTLYQWSKYSCITSSPTVELGTGVDSVAMV